VSIHEMKSGRFLTPKQVAALFPDSKSGTKSVRWVYRNASGRGFLASAARRFTSKTLLFDAATIERIIGEAS
jgi:hypothetical protein